MSQKLKISLKLDEKFKQIAAGLPPMQIEVKDSKGYSVPMTIKGEPLYANHHAEILCHYAKGGQRSVQQYVKLILKKQDELKAKLTIENNTKTQANEKSN